jgi:hypothetical protein
VDGGGRHPLRGLDAYHTSAALLRWFVNLSCLTVRPSTSMVALETSEVIEDYPALHRPLPDCLVLGYLATGEPLHAVIALDEANDRLFIVTVYKPSREEWQDDWRTRKD